MRTPPIIKDSENSDKIFEARIQKVTRIVAIAFVVIIQLAIILKMLI